eukprot:5758135-Alexandrium_andersonii.AAC.1
MAFHWRCLGLCVRTGVKGFMVCGVWCVGEPCGCRGARGHGSASVARAGSKSVENDGSWEGEGPRALMTCVSSLFHECRERMR